MALVSKPPFDSIRNKFSLQHIIDSAVIIEVSDTVCYYGFAKPGTAENSEGWAIMKETVTTPTGLNSKTVRQWASGDQRMNKNLSKYAEYTYS